MTTRTITSEQDLGALFALLRNRKPPFTVQIVQGRKRSLEQNQMQRALIRSVAEQLDDHTAEYWRGYCKLRFGVPIRRRDDEYFRQRYDTHVKPLPYETKIALMMEPIDFPITRDMTTAQKTEYLEDLMRHFAEQGVRFEEAA